jgi:hypothetical protein
MLGRYLRVKGLDKDKIYNIQPLDITVKGDVLMNAGIPIKSDFTDFNSILFEINEV